MSVHVEVKEIGEILRVKIVKGIICDEENCVFNQLGGGWRLVLLGFSACCSPCRTLQSWLELKQKWEFQQQGTKVKADKCCCWMMLIQYHLLIWDEQMILPSLAKDKHSARS